MKRLGLPIAVSLSIHLARAALFAFGAFSLYRMEAGGGGGGRGGVVSVWIARPDGQISGDASSAEPRRKGRVSTSKGPIVHADKRPEAGIAASERAASAAAGSNHPSSDGSEGAGGGSGGGVGGGLGAGIGRGSGGDPTLAKIWRKINRSKYYPQGAKERGIEGSPRVTFTIAEDGSVGSIKLASSCGEALLDEAARETIRRAAPLPHYPRPITLTVKYSLQD